MKYSSQALTYIGLAILICSVCYEAYLSFKSDEQRLSLRAYLKLQIIKVGALYFLLDLIVLAHGGWKLKVVNWVGSLFGVFVLSILFGYVTSFLTRICLELCKSLVADAYRSPFIAECVFAAAEHGNR